MWRIHFTAEDLARTRIAPTLGPLAETLFGLRLMRCRRTHGPAFGLWRQAARARITSAMQPLAALTPAGGIGLDLWSLTGETRTIEDGCDAILAMRPEHVRAEMEFFADGRRLPTSTWQVAERDPQGRRDLAAAAMVSYRSLLEPHWPRVQSHLHGERTARGRVLLEGGIESLLATLHPKVAWRSPVLEIDVRNDTEVHLRGRGLVLVPSIFVGECPLLMTDLSDPTAAPRLVFSAAQDPDTVAQLWTDGHPDSLGALLGRNRAAVLTRINGGCTTSELAHRAGISLAAASQHASVLRRAGLITTRRAGGAVIHTLTSLGVDLLSAQ